MNNTPIPENKFWEMYGRVCAERDLLREQLAELQQRLNNLTDLKAKKENESDS